MRGLPAEPILDSNRSGDILNGHANAAVAQPINSQVQEGTWHLRKAEALSSHRCAGVVHVEQRRTNELRRGFCEHHVDGGSVY